MGIRRAPKGCCKRPTPRSIAQKRRGETAARWLLPLISRFWPWLAKAPAGGTTPNPLPASLSPFGECLGSLDEPRRERDRHAPLFLIALDGNPKAPALELGCCRAMVRKRKIIVYITASADGFIARHD